MNEYTCRRVKWNPVKNADELQPFGLAEMEFKLDESVQKEIVKYMEDSVMGYPQAPESYYNTIVSWLNKRYHKDIENDDIVITPGVVPAIKNFIQLKTILSKEVVILTPAYNNFYTGIEETGRKTREVELDYQDGNYTINYSRLENALEDSNVEMMIMCNPHNPIARVWTLDELQKVKDLCDKYNVFLISDEIHGDIIMADHEFVSMLNIDSNIPICTSGSKTFNIAGFKTANIVIRNEKLREEFSEYSRIHNTLGSGALGIFGTEKSYELSEEWFLDKLEIIKTNVNIVEQHLKDSKVIVTQQQATYLMWLNFNYYLKKNENFFRILSENGIHFSEGTMYGMAGKGFARVNVATDTKCIESLMEKLTKILEKVENNEL